jgi:hypothetical protein
VAAEVVTSIRGGAHPGIRRQARFVGGRREDVRVADEVVSSARGRGKTQGNIPLAALPFTHLSVPNAEQYRRLLRVFARAKGRFIVHLRPEDTAAELRIDADEQLTEALDQLVKWGNLRADVDTSRVTTVEDFHRKRSHRGGTLPRRPEAYTA